MPPSLNINMRWLDYSDWVSVLIPLFNFILLHNHNKNVLLYWHDYLTNTMLHLSSSKCKQCRENANIKICIYGTIKAMMYSSYSWVHERGALVVLNLQYFWKSGRPLLTLLKNYDRQPHTFSNRLLFSLALGKQSPNNML